MICAGQWLSNAESSIGGGLEALDRKGEQRLHSAEVCRQFEALQFWAAMHIRLFPGRTDPGRPANVSDGYPATTCFHPGLEALNSHLFRALRFIESSTYIASVYQVLPIVGNIQTGGLNSVLTRKWHLTCGPPHKCLRR
jgi:hypothetical protein